MRSLRMAALVAAFSIVSRSGVALLAAWTFTAAAAQASPLAGDPSVAAVIGAGMPERPSTGRADTLAIARRHLGTNPTGRRSLWCADFLNLVERQAGRPGTGSRLARAYLGYGRPVRLAEARPGDIVILSRGRRDGRGGHVGYLVSRSGGTVRLVSGNACRPRRVCESNFPAGRILGIRRP